MEFEKFSLITSLPCKTPNLIARTTTSNRMPALTQARKLLNQIPPRRETAWITQANAATARAMPLTVPLLGWIPGFAAWSTRTAKAILFPAMFPRQMKLIPKRQPLRRTVSFL